jgi:hypothetical protein
MAEKHAAARSLTLKEAIERHTPKEVWQRYWAIAEEEIPLLIFRDPSVLNMEARGLREGIERTLTAKLRKGELIASGLALPLRPTHPTA